MKKYKVAFCNRRRWDAPLGGDGIQMLKTKEFLEKNHNVSIDIITDPSKLDSRYDLVHIFNYSTIYETEAFFKIARQLDIPIASSSIFWDYSYAWDKVCNLFITNSINPFNAYLIRFTTRLCSTLLGYPQFFSFKFRKKVKSFMEYSSCILPNSIEEGELLLKNFKATGCREKINVVVNASDSISEVSVMPRNEFFSKYKIPCNYILQVGRIEPVKNQINVVLSLLDYPEIPIVFLGKIKSNSYFTKLKKLSDKRGNVYFLDAVPHDDVFSFYSYAALHILPSLRESPGLVSLEAMACNCPIIVADSRFAPVKTYFSNQKYIINPLDVNNIQQVIIKAYRERYTNKELITKFTWEEAARQTWMAYEKILIV